MKWVMAMSKNRQWTKKGRFATKIVSEGDGIPAELFRILNDNAVNGLDSIHQQIWKIYQWPQGWKRSAFILIPKKGDARECSNHHTPNSTTTY